MIRRPPRSTPLSLHDALPISSTRVHAARESRKAPVPAHLDWRRKGSRQSPRNRGSTERTRSEEHTSELQSHVNLVCRLLLEKKKEKRKILITHKISLHAI